MLRKISIFIIIFLLHVTSCFSIIAGTTEDIYDINDCISLNVTVTSDFPIDYGEYEFLNCTLNKYDVYENRWNCMCNNTNPYQLTMAVQDTTKNTYSLELNYIYKEVKNTFNPGGGGFRREVPQHIQRWVFINNAERDPTIRICKPGECDTPTTTSTTYNNIPTTTYNKGDDTMTTTSVTSTTLLEESVKTTPSFSMKLGIVILGGVILLLLISLVIYWIYSAIKKRKANKEKDNEINNAIENPSRHDIPPHHLPPIQQHKEYGSELCPKCMGEIRVKQVGSSNIKECLNCKQGFTMDLKHQIPFKQESEDYSIPSQQEKNISQPDTNRYRDMERGYIGENDRAVDYNTNEDYHIPDTKDEYKSVNEVKHTTPNRKEEIFAYPNDTLNSLRDKENVRMPRPKDYNEIKEKSKKKENPYGFSVK